ncbi:hypothetical protein [Ochrobactrum chromiisoli]|uniref:Ubiquitin-like domain-containing protein n=1 Tax=Ochrobactrum chromiisoli TaxID=2993941 RepID=A0ABT3QKV9_9HYPH|nr:hypothetical protein [Ochrobactrum chromiisoli]MCX2696241.1 hypothetical protein [Ochrobactrum chromiisoli]
MLNPILPKSTSGGVDPALEGRVTNLENTFSDVELRVSDSEIQISNVASDVETLHINVSQHDEEITVLRDIRFALVDENRNDYTAAWLFGQPNNWLSQNSKLADYGVTERDYVFQVNGVDRAIQFVATDTMNDILMKFIDIASMNSVSYTVELFGGQIRFEVGGGDSLVFPTPGFPDFQHLWYVLGLAGQSAISTAVEVPYSLRDTDIWTLQGTVDKQIQRLSLDARAAASAASRSASLPLLDQPMIINTGYIFPDNTGNILSENTDLSNYLTDTDTFEITVDGTPFSITAGPFLDVPNILGNLNTAGIPDCFFQYFAGGVRLEVRSNSWTDHEISITGGKIAQVLGLSGKSLSYKAVENFSSGLDVSAISRYSPYVGGQEGIEALINVQRQEIDALNLLTSKLAYEIEQLKAGS